MRSEEEIKVGELESKASVTSLSSQTKSEEVKKEAAKSNLNFVDLKGDNQSKAALKNQIKKFEFKIEPKLLKKKEQEDYKPIWGEYKI